MPPTVSSGLTPEHIAHILTIASDAGFPMPPGASPEQAARHFAKDPVLARVIAKADPDALAAATAPPPMTMGSMQQAGTLSDPIPSGASRPGYGGGTSGNLFGNQSTPGGGSAIVAPNPPDPRRAAAIEAAALNSSGIPPVSTYPAAAGAQAPAETPTVAPAEPAAAAPARPGFIPYTQAWGMATSGDSTKKDIHTITTEYNRIAQDQMQAAYARAYADGEAARVQAGTDAYNKVIQSGYSAGEDDAARERRALAASATAYGQMTDPTALAEQALTGTEKYFESGLTGLRQTLPTGSGGGGGGDPYAASREARAQAEFERTGIWHEEEKDYRASRDLVTDANRAEDVRYRNDQAAEAKNQFLDGIRADFIKQLHGSAGGFAAPGSDYLAGAEPGGALEALSAQVGVPYTPIKGPALPTNLSSIAPRGLQGADLMMALAGGR